MNEKNLELFGIFFSHLAGLKNREAHSDHVYYETIKEAEDHAAMKLRQNLDGVWLYTYVTDHSLYIRDFYKTEYNCSDFEMIHVKNQTKFRNASARLHSHESVDSIGCYIKRFFLKEGLQGKRMFLSFGQLESCYCFWLNGQLLGFGTDSALSVEFEVTHLLCDGENKLAAALWGCSRKSANYHRFLRHTVLYGVPVTHMDHLSVKMIKERESDRSKLDVKISISGKTEGTIGAILKDNISQMLLVGHVPVSKEVRFLYQLPEMKPQKSGRKMFYTLLLILFDENKQVVEAVPYDFPL